MRGLIGRRWQRDRIILAAPKKKSQEHGSTQLKRALEYLRGQSDWQKLDRLIVITDEQAHDGILSAWTAKAYVVNVAPYKNGKRRHN